jgi:hypothetical protein
MVLPENLDRLELEILRPPCLSIDCESTQKQQLRGNKMNGRGDIQVNQAFNVIERYLKVRFWFIEQLPCTDIISKLFLAQKLYWFQTGFSQKSSEPHGRNLTYNKLRSSRVYRSWNDFATSFVLIGNLTKSSRRGIDDFAHGFAQNVRLFSLVRNIF